MQQLDISVYWIAISNEEKISSRSCNVHCALCIEKEARCILFCYNRAAVCNIYVLWIIDAQHCAHYRQYSPYEREKISLNKINCIWYSLVDGFLAGSVFDGFKHINIHYLVNNVWIHETRHFIPYYKAHAPSATNSSAHIHTMSLLHTNLSSLQKKHKFPNIIPYYDALCCANINNISTKNLVTKLI